MSPSPYEYEQPADQGRDNLSKNATIASVIAVVVCISTCIYNSPSALLLSVIIFLPTLFALRYRKYLPTTQRGDLTTIAWVYLFTTTISIPFVMLSQLIVALGSAQLCFGTDTAWFLNEFQTVTKESDIRDDEHRATRAVFVKRPRYWAFLLLSTFVLVGVSEELQKYVALRLARQLRKGQTGSVEHVIYGGIVGLAYATFEGLMFVMSARKDSGSGLLLQIAARLNLGMAGHILCGLSTAVEMIKHGEQASYGLGGAFRMIRRSTLFHGLGNFGLAGYSAIRGHVGFLNPEGSFDIAACFTISAMASAALAVLLRKDFEKIKVD